MQRAAPSDPTAGKQTILERQPNACAHDFRRMANDLSMAKGWITNFGSHESVVGFDKPPTDEFGSLQGLDYEWFWKHYQQRCRSECDSGGFANCNFECCG